VPVEFLTDDQAAAHGRFTGEPSRADLERRGEHNRLVFAVELGTVRYLGTFLADPVDVPWSMMNYVAVQLDVPDPSVIKRYTEREKTAYEHA
jgi:hypothetical protein